MQEFVGLRSKMYAKNVEGNTKLWVKKYKGVERSCKQRAVNKNKKLKKIKNIASVVKN